MLRPQDPQFEAGLFGQLVWIPSLGMGRYPVPDYSKYDAYYFNKYVEYAGTELGNKLTEFRAGLVRHYALEFDLLGRELLDVGIGCGSFLEAVSDDFQVEGFDVNPRAVKWLRDREIFVNPYVTSRKEWPVITFFDSLEHLHAPAAMVTRGRLIVISMPIFRDVNHLLRSHHYRPDEHVWYWTFAGLCNWLEKLGYEKVAHTDFETKAGRADVCTFVFLKRR